MLLLVPTVLSAAMIGVAFVLGEPVQAQAFAACAVIGGALVGLLRLIANPTDEPKAAGATMATVALGWAIIGVLAAVPFYLSPIFAPENPALPVFLEPENALFEAFSAVTSTGLTMVDKPSNLPAVIQFWRSLLQWVGGVGIALLMLALLNPNTDGGDVFGAELNQQFADTAKRTALVIWSIYAGLTVIAISTFSVLGMPWWESLNHGMTAVATGGFTVTDDSFQSYSTAIQTATAVLILLGGISFAAYRQVIATGNPLVLFRRGPVVFLLIGIALLSAAIWLWPDGPSDSRARGVFEVISAFTTAGFTTAKLEYWQPSALALLIIGMLIGGASGATTGGFKTDRALLVIRGGFWRLQRLFRSEPESEVEINGETFSIIDARLRVETAAGLITLWLATAVGGSLALYLSVGDQFQFDKLIFETVSALGGVGLSAGVASADLPWHAKGVLITLMWLGRLEILSCLALFWLPLAKPRNTGLS